MDTLRKILLAILLLSLSTPLFAASTVRIKDIAVFRSDAEIDLIGYGLVIGLDGSGDGKGTKFTTQALVNMMERMGLTVDPNEVKTKNVAAVMVTAKMTASNQPGSRIDATVSSVGDASSLQGGTLLMTPLSSVDGIVFAVSQGPVSIGGFNIQVENGNRIVNNYTLVGRVPGGALVQKQIDNPGDSRELFLTLLSPDYSTATQIIDRVNQEYGTTAYALDEGTVKIRVPDSLMRPNDRLDFIAGIGQFRVSPDAPAKVVINEKTGTIVAGEHVSISPVALAHGNITISIKSRPVISQPNSFSDGETVVTTESQVTVEDEIARVVEFPEIVTISQVAQALNSIGAAPRDIIAIFQALKEAGALRAELVLL